jgi:formylglycine-generating enzyme required for sulfatase activity
MNLRMQGGVSILIMALTAAATPVWSQETDRIFSVTNPPAVPAVEAPEELGQAATGLDLGSLDVDALEKYLAAAKLEKGDAPPADKAEAWRRLAQDAPKVAAVAKRRAADWERVAAQQKAADEAGAARTKARDADWKKLESLLGLESASAADKNGWAEQFLAAYLKSPGLEPAMAKELAALAAPGARRDELEKLARETSRQKAGIEWVRIPGGAFRMGSGKWSGNFDEKPPHDVTIKPFQMAKTLVTNKQYRACVADGACTPAKDFGAAFDGEEQPVVGVDWNQAKAFAAWAGGRLPSESEWEYAARSAGQEWEYPWGSEDATCDRAVIAGCGYVATAPVCSKPAGNTEQGLCDMTGDALEWVEESYHDSYKDAPRDGSAREDAGSPRVNRGGAWYDVPGNTRSATRGHDPLTRRASSLSFRPVR